MKRFRKQNAIWFAAVFALVVGGATAAKIKARTSRCDTSAAGVNKECDHHAAGQAQAHSHAEAAAELPPGHPEISKAGKMAAPPLDEKQLAQGKAADCPYMSQAANEAPAKSPKNDAINDLKDFVLESTKEGGKAR